MKMYSEMTKAEQAKLRSYEKAGNSIHKHCREILKIIEAKAERGG